MRNFKLRKWKSSKLRNLKVESSNCESEKSSNLSLQTWNLKLRKWKFFKVLKLRAESFQLLSFDKLQVLKLRIRTACSKLSCRSWMLKVVECWKLKVVECWKLSNVRNYVIKVESWKLLNLVEYWKLLNLESCQTLKVVECWKFANCKNLLSTNKFSKAFILYTIWY